MSRSVKRKPFSACCGTSQKQDKRIGNRIMRRATRILARIADPDTVIYPVYDEAMNKWSMAQDGSRKYMPLRSRSKYCTQEEWAAVRLSSMRK